MRPKRLRMKIGLLIGLSLLLSMTSFAQTKFEQGYFIDLNNRKTECLIKNYDWKYNPVEIEYKLSEGEESRKAGVKTIREFGIVNESKYVGSDVRIDRTTDNLDDLTYDKNPVWSRERLFLKVLVEGKARLFYYADGNLRRYFYQFNDTIKQLVYKKYLLENNEAVSNYAFRQQLSAEVRCGTSTDDLKRTDYNYIELVRHFKAYNDCSGGTTIDYTKPKKHKNLFHLKVKPGINYSSLSVKDFYTTGSNNKSVTFDAQTNLRIGLEAEFVLPYNNNQWSLVIDPNYQTFKSTAKFKTMTLTADYTSLEFPVGVRHYFFLKEKARILISGFLVPGAPLSSTVNMGDNIVLEVVPKLGYAFDLGFDVKKMSVEVRYYRNSNILNRSLYWNGNYERWSLIVGYRLF